LKPSLGEDLRKVVRAVSLSVAKRNRSTIALYERDGFTAVE
jgi:ribosomal protein S18 acetylase RimI-like enzyme